jgi:hypothetical protein
MNIRIASDWDGLPASYDQPSDSNGRYRSIYSLPEKDGITAYARVQLGNFNLEPAFLMNQMQTQKIFWIGFILMTGRRSTEMSAEKES